MTFPRVFYPLATLFALAAPLVHAQTCTESTAGDCIVAKGQLLNQTTYIGTQNLYTTTSGGDFETYIDVESVVTVKDSDDGAGVFAYTWTDDIGTHTRYLGGDCSLQWWIIERCTESSGSYGSNLPLKIRLNPGTTFSINISPMSLNGTPALPPAAGNYYNIFWKVKHLGNYGTN